MSQGSKSSRPTTPGACSLSSFSPGWSRLQTGRHPPGRTLSPAAGPWAPGWALPQGTRPPSNVHSALGLHCQNSGHLGPSSAPLAPPGLTADPGLTHMSPWSPRKTALSPFVTRHVSEAGTHPLHLPTSMLGRALSPSPWSTQPSCQPGEQGADLDPGSATFHRHLISPWLTFTAAPKVKAFSLPNRGAPRPQGAGPGRGVTPTPRWCSLLSLLAQGAAVFLLHPLLPLQGGTSPTGLLTPLFFC